MACALRVGIQTIDRDVLLNNYGSFFQHCALRMVLKRLGYSVFRCESISFKDKVKFAMLPLLLLRVYVFHIAGLRKGKTWRGWWRMLLLMRFVLDYWRLIGRVFESQAEAGVYLAGGDSVWCSTSRTAFLLDKPHAARRIAFAASSAWEKFSNRIGWTDNVKEAIETYFAIGVREETGAAVIKAIAEPRRIAVVSDPVLLLDSQVLKGMAAPCYAFKRPVLLCYVVNVCRQEDMNLKALKGCAATLSCDLKIVGIQGSEDYIPSEYVARPSPREFLAMVRDAKCVVTNSFHGMCSHFNSISSLLL